jgi:hypothetical protein
MQTIPATSLVSTKRGKMAGQAAPQKGDSKK